MFLKQQLRIYFKAGIINEVVNKTVNGDINVAVIVVIIEGVVYGDKNKKRNQNKFRKMLKNTDNILLLVWQRL